jgi:hypothetical protein
MNAHCRRITLGLALPFLAAAPALAAGPRGAETDAATPIVVYSFTTPATPALATRLRMDATGKSGGCAYGPTTLLGAQTNSGWLLTPPPSPANPSWMRMHWNGGAKTGQTFTAGVLIPACLAGPATPYQSFAWCSWRNAGDGIISTWPLGWKISSPPILYNHNLLPDGSPNAQNMVVRNIKFAESSEPIDPKTFDPNDPRVTAIFNASSDPTRPGPFTVPPGTELSVTPAPTIPGTGRTILVRGTVDISGGGAVTFVTEFQNPSIVPMAPPVALALMGLVLFGMGAFYFRRSGFQGTA